MEACKETSSPLLELINNARASVDLFCCEKPRCARTDAGVTAINVFFVFAIGILIDEWQADNYAFGAP